MELRRRLGAAGLVVALLWLLALWSFHVSHHASLTAPASALLRNRRASSLGPADAASLDSSPIPRIIHQTWKTKSLPPWAIEPVASWKRLNPTWRHILHDDADMDRIVRASYPAIWPAYSTMKPIQKSDVFRYVVVLAQGGVYADIDVTASTPADKWVAMAGEYPPSIDFVVGFEAVNTKNKTSWTKWFADDFQLCQWCFASRKNHPMLRSVLETIVQYYALGRHRESKSVIKSTGPGIWSKGIQRALLRDYGLTFGARLH
jgi:alpha 1,6-mannosyltransferase